MSAPPSPAAYGRASRRARLPHIPPLEHRDKGKVGRAGILDVMAKAFLHVADIARKKIRRRGFRPGIEDRHPPLALDVVLPLIRIRVPMHFPYAARLYRDHARRQPSSTHGNSCYPQPGSAAGVRPVRLHIRETVDERIGRRTRRRGNRLLVGRKRPGNFALENPALLQRDILESIRRHAEILRQHLRRRMREPVGEQQRVVLTGSPLSKASTNSAPSGPSPCSYAANRGEIPEIALLHIRDIGAARASSRSPGNCRRSSPPIRPAGASGARGCRPHRAACSRRRCLSTSGTSRR